MKPLNRPFFGTSRKVSAMHFICCANLSVLLCRSQHVKRTPSKSNRPVFRETALLQCRFGRDLRIEAMHPCLSRTAKAACSILAKDPDGRAACMWHSIAYQNPGQGSPGVLPPDHKCLNCFQFQFLYLIVSHRIVECISELPKFSVGTHFPQRKSLPYTNSAGQSANANEDQLVLMTVW